MKTMKTKTIELKIEYVSTNYLWTCPKCGNDNDSNYDYEDYSKCAECGFDLGEENFSSNHEEYNDIEVEIEDEQ